MAMVALSPTEEILRDNLMAFLPAKGGAQLRHYGTKPGHLLGQKSETRNPKSETNPKQVMSQIQIRIQIP
jgi:hypothetical protein